MKHALVRAGVEGFKDSFRLVCALFASVVAVVSAFSLHQSMGHRPSGAVNHDSRLLG